MKGLGVAMLVLVAILQLGGLALSAHSSEWLPVPPDLCKVEGGRVFVHATWTGAVPAMHVPILSACLCLVAAGILVPRRRRTDMRYTGVREAGEKEWLTR